MVNEFEATQDTLRQTNRTEGAEVAAEAKERDAEAQEKQMAAKERVETVAKEVKTTKQQIQNIMVNMQQVVKAVQAIRAKLQLVQNDDDIPSVQRDKAALEYWQTKLKGLYGEISDLRGALLAEESKAVVQEHPDWSNEAVIGEVERRVAETFVRLGVAKENS